MPASLRTFGLRLVGGAGKRWCAACDDESLVPTPKRELFVVVSSDTGVASDGNQNGAVLTEVSGMPPECREGNRRGVTLRSLER